MYTTVPALACVSVQSLVWILDNDCAKKALKSGSARVNGHRHGKGRGGEWRGWLYMQTSRGSRRIYHFTATKAQKERTRGKRTRETGNVHAWMGGDGGKVAKIHCI